MTIYAAVRLIQGLYSAGRAVPLLGKERLLEVKPLEPGEYVLAHAGVRLILSIAEDDTVGIRPDLVRKVWRSDLELTGRPDATSSVWGNITVPGISLLGAQKAGLEVVAVRPKLDSKLPAVLVGPDSDGMVIRLERGVSPDRANPVPTEGQEVLGRIEKRKPQEPVSTTVPPGQKIGGAGGG